MQRKEKGEVRTIKTKTHTRDKHMNSEQIQDTEKKTTTKRHRLGGRTSKHTHPCGNVDIHIS